MANVLGTNGLFPEKLATQLISGVKGKSALAVLSGATPVSFTGNKEFIFTLDKEVDLVAENGAKTVGGGTITPVSVIPYKVEYSMRVSDEFMNASEEYQLDILSQFSDGFSKKLARALDIMAMHGVNPRTKTESALIGNNCFDKVVTQIVEEADGVSPDTNIESAIELIQDVDADVNGLILSNAARSALAKLTKADGSRLYPDLAWGNMPGSINGLPTQVNSTVTFVDDEPRAYLGDFANMFKWGYASKIPMEIIQYGNPDNDPDLGDLKGHNQIMLRAEAYIGWGILMPKAFAKIVKKK